jgi:Cu/Ag efflux pump CusA
MFLPDISIKRPVLATVMSLAMILIGVISFLRLPVREYPNIDAPVVSVRTVYPGASAEIMESQVTQPLEDSLAALKASAPSNRSAAKRSAKSRSSWCWSGMWTPPPTTCATGWRGCAVSCRPK